jgi:hypothetical protein
VQICTELKVSEIIQQLEVLVFLLFKKNQNWKALAGGTGGKSPPVKFPTNCVSNFWYNLLYHLKKPCEK